MRIVILFGGGDAGGLIIGPNGVEPIPPFDPRVRVQLGATAALLKAAEQLADDELGSVLAEHAESLAKRTVRDVERDIAEIGPEGGIAFIDIDAVLWCGNEPPRIVPRGPVPR